MIKCSGRMGTILNNFIKRIMDLVIAFFALLFFLPVWIVIAILIKLDSPGPIFYTHPRIAKGGKEFPCFKFRSMYIDSDPNKLAASNEDPRITKIGKFIRKTSLDETPQILNVFRGEMSTVGPRPALPLQVEHFSEQDKLKLTVKPGLTGWTQVNGRNSIPYEKRMELDVWYAKNNNVFLDMLILIKTVKVLLTPNDIYDAKSTSPVK